jgi:hypothetical protein
MDFFSNRGIEKVEKRDSAYWVWVPNGTTSFKIGVPEYPLLEIDLPKTKAPGLFIIILNTTTPRKIIYKDTLAPLISIRSKPGNAEVFINGAYQGLTPLEFNVPFDTFSLSLERKRYKKLENTIVLDGNTREFNLKLEHDPFSRRLFVYTSTGLTKKMAPTIGAGIGQIGKTGWYISGETTLLTIINPYNESIDRALGIDQENIHSWNQDPAIFYVLEEDYKTIEFYSRLTAGITQQVFAKGFIFAGLGLSIGRYYALLDKYYYSDNSPAGSDYAVVLNETYRQVVEIDAGLIYRVGDHLILNMTCANNIGKYYPATWSWYFREMGSNEKVKYAGFNLSFGLGYNF